MKSPFIRTMIEREEVESTSDLARTLLETEAFNLPLCVIAKRQTRGRGQHDRSWWSDEGSLTFTLAINPNAHNLTRAHEPRIALAAAVALIQALPEGTLAGIRWPNDIEVMGRKIGGILPERIETAFGSRILIGIGLNLETDLDRASPDVRAMAISLREVTGEVSFHRDALLNRFFDLCRIVLQSLSRNDPNLAGRWQALDTLRDQAIRINLGPRVVSAIARGIDDEGALVVETDGETTRLFGGRVLRDSW